MNKFASILTFVSLLSVTPVFAQPAQNNFERTENRQEKMDNKRARHDDRLDVRELEGLLARFDAARSVRDIRGLDDVDRLLQGILATELIEGRGEVAQKAGEKDRSAMELRGSRQEVARDVAVAAPPPVVRRDARDAQDDRADLRDDQRDMVGRQDLQVRRRAIAQELSGLYLRHRRPLLIRKRELMVELIQLARLERDDNRREKHEDRQERQEDRHERQEDRRQGY